MSTQHECQSMDELLLAMHLAIAAHRWSYTEIHAEPDAPDWIHPNGMCAGFDHAELVSVGVCSGTATHVLSELCHRVEAGERFVHGQETDVGGLTVRFVEVHPGHFENLFAGWLRYYAALDPPRPPTLRALQVVAPEEALCRHHAGRQLVLDEECSVAVYQRGKERRARRRPAHPRRRPRRRLH